MIKSFFTFTLVFTMLSLNAQNFWSKKDEKQISLRNDDQRTLIPEKYHVFSLDLDGMKHYLKQVPMEGQSKVGLDIQLPLSNGKLETFEVFEAPSMQEGLSSKYPNIKSYKAYSKTTRMFSARFAVGPNGFYAAVNGFDGEKYIDPYSEKNIIDYIVYDVKDHKSDIYKNTPMCGVEFEGRPANTHFNPMASRNAGIVDLRVFKLAMACTGQWGSRARRGTVEKCLADMNVMITRMNAIYEKEMAMRFVLIDDNEKLIFINPATDPYQDKTPTGSGRDILPKNTGIINGRITGGASSYDVGHVLHICTDIGGVAQGGSACQNNKGNGVTCNNDNDLTNIVTRVMAHEVGHQFDASHTWNICQPNTPDVDNQRAPNFAYEPGSGSTIMSYAGSCGSDNVLNDNDDYFHVASLNQMYNKTYQGGNAFVCSDKVPTSNHFPEVTIPTELYTIPISTPFELKGSATDEDGDVLTYCWEQYDLGPKVALGTNGATGPLFRSYRPSPSGDVRFFPRSNDILTGSTTNKTEVLPNVSRDMTFRLTVRDNNAQVGGVVWEEMKVTATDAAGPFVITYPLTEVRFKVGEAVEVTWDVAKTDLPPVNCKAVNIYGSFSSAIRTDDPNLVPLALNVPNDGSQVVYIPNRISNFFRIIIKAADNIFLTSSRSASRIEASTEPSIYVAPVENEIKICQPEPAIVNIITEGLAGFAGDITFSVVSGLPDGATAAFANEKIAAGQQNTLTIYTDNVVGSPIGQITILATADGVEAVTRVINFAVEGGNLANVQTLTPENGAENVTGLPRFHWNKKEDGKTYEIQLADNADFSASSIIFQRVLADSTSIIQTLLEKSKIYYWRVRAGNDCRFGEWSEVSAFITEASVCKSYNSGEQSITIPTAGTPTVELPLEINDQGTVSDVNIKQIRAQHSRLSDVVAFLVAPSGAEVLLWSRQCATQQNINVSLDDQAPDFFQCPINTGRLYRTNTNNPTTPAQRLELLNGESMKGTWKLRIEDKQTGSGGSLQYLDLEICSNLTVDRPFIVRNDTLKIYPSDKQFITDILLLSADNNNTADELIYTLVKVPSKGVLTYNGMEISGGAKFTQADINTGSLRYVSQTTDNTTDDFTFTVYDGQGGWIGITAFNILIDSSIPSNVNDITLEQDVFLYPNPTANNINIVLTGNASILTSYTLTDISGRKLIAGQLSGTLTEINTQAIANGIYFLTLTDGKRSVSKKLIKI